MKSLFWGMLLCGWYWCPTCKMVHVNGREEKDGCVASEYIRWSKAMTDRERAEYEAAHPAESGDGYARVASRRGKP